MVNGKESMVRVVLVKLVRRTVVITVAPRESHASPVGVFLTDGCDTMIGIIIAG